MTLDPEDLERPFWSDDHDMDLPKIIPDALRMLGDLASVELTTSGTPCGKTGRLNLPCCWNTDIGSTAFFGFNNPGRDTNFYVAPHAREIKCTAWEAFRDAWCHHFVMVIDGQRVWDAQPLWPHYETIMWNLRGWGDGRKKLDDAKARRAAVRSYEDAVRRFGRIVNTRSAVKAAASPLAQRGE
ncbi:hypothetical protein V1291_000003 [Nitrobacteraceae bacterium AZCC 1564]